MVIGTYLGQGLVCKKLYVGPEECLQGKTALVYEGIEPETYAAQFDDTETGFGYGWHKFSISDFKDNNDGE